MFSPKCHSTIFFSHFCYTLISPVQGRCIIVFPLSCQFLSRYPSFFPHRGRLLLHPEGLYLLKQTILQHMFFLMASRLVPTITDRKQLFPQISLLKSAESTLRFKVLTRFIHWGDHKHDSNIKLSKFVSVIKNYGIHQMNSFMWRDGFIPRRIVFQFQCISEYYQPRL